MPIRWPISGISRRSARSWRTAGTTTAPCSTGYWPRRSRARRTGEPRAELGQTSAFEIACLSPSRRSCWPAGRLYVGTLAVTGNPEPTMSGQVVVFRDSAWTGVREAQLTAADSDDPALHGGLGACVDRHRQ